MTGTDVSNFLSAQLRSLFSQFSSDQIDAAINLAQLELGWTLPTNDTIPEQGYWFVERTKRHALEMLRTEASFKFDYKTAKLSDRYTQLTELVEGLDIKFKAILEAEPALFTTFKPLTQFGTYIDNGFTTSKTGADLTHRHRVNRTKFWGAGTEAE